MHIASRDVCGDIILAASHCCMGSFVEVLVLLYRVQWNIKGLVAFTLNSVDRATMCPLSPPLVPGSARPESS